VYADVGVFIYVCEYIVFLELMYVYIYIYIYIYMNICVIF